MQISHNDLADILARKLTEAVDMDTLEDFFCDHHEQYYRKDADISELKRTAIDLGIIDETDTLEIID
jgi:hypothetical protein